MRALVSAASRHGATAGIANAIASTLRERGLSVDVLDPEHVHDLGSYEVVVVGSAVYMGRWMPVARSLVARHTSALRWRDVWLFSSGPLGEPPRFTEEPSDVVTMISESGARGHALFSGRLDPTVLGLRERLMAHSVHAPVGDFRDWTAIGEWANQIADTTLMSGSGRTSATQKGSLVPVPGVRR